jgi:hypothetical protein
MESALTDSESSIPMSTDTLKTATHSQEKENLNELKPFYFET